MTEKGRMPCARCSASTELYMTVTRRMNALVIGRGRYSSSSESSQTARMYTDISRILWAIDS